MDLIESYASVINSIKIRKLAFHQIKLLEMTKKFQIVINENRRAVKEKGYKKNKDQLRLSFK